MKSTQSFKQMKQEREKIAMVTSYDAPSAGLAEKGEVDLILVGDSVGMTVLGYDSTVPVTMEDMILHTRAVRRGAPGTFTVADLPFLTYHASREQAFKNAGRLMQEGGAHAVKLEGGNEVLDTITALVQAGVPVVAHLGLTPQSAGVIGGYKVQGKTAEQATELLREAERAEKAGAFMLVLECVPSQVAKKVSEALSIPVIGIGAGPETDGQVLVWHDLIGYSGTRVPKFVKKYANLAPEITSAISEYRKEVKQGAFPKEEHSFSMDEEELDSLYSRAGESR
ncbi:3-methyl-2-oxobutanoate hydroxymethyltransferase [Alteribacter natronophilus]|uniref:3-methyl-2-oxobutanoate hydroxymethyltransferase n=1 Tax=Alteribacter natronophilus TaxID=2583810 RepID=UPI00110EDB18|nr:3-methyl-2-oxobutanoate hydroxymethyltransferase [Alteribacter natronophilus]TMW73569.1 3-methyl-2-oxobutanoate hydroxymethyltransferase [Alteribacter natronophilus]